MPANTERRTSHSRVGSAWSYPSELQPLRQSLIAALAKVDFELASDIETVRSSSVDEWVKQTTIRKRSEEHTSELQSRQYLVCRLLLEKKHIHDPGRDS